MDWSTIEKLIVSAELLFERSELKMVGVTLDSISERTKDVEFSSESPDLYERFMALCELVPDTEVGTHMGRPSCHKCGGSGKHTNGGTCFGCMGKGWQTPRDIVREKNYWARREAIAIGRRAKRSNPPF